MNEMISFENVSKSYSSNETVVKNLNIKIDRGELIVLVGPSGCGKTTTMKMINRLIDPTEGKIFIDGQDSSLINPLTLRKDIGYVIQHTGLFPHMTIEENIATVPKLKKWDKKVIENRVTELLQLVGLDAELTRKKLPGQLSGGQQQRIGVARALAGNPPIMLMDEPFGALDPITRSHLQNELLKIQKNVRKTIIFVTHDIDEAVKLGDRIAVMRNGVVIQYDIPSTILKTPADQFIANLTGEDRAIKLLSLIPVSRIITLNNNPDPELSFDNTIKDSCSLKEVLEMILETGKTELKVCDSSNRIIGSVSLSSILEVVSKK